MDHFEIKISKVNEPTCLAMIECLGLLEVDEIFVVSEDLYWEGGGSSWS